jgi:hypothetical protein
MIIAHTCNPSYSGGRDQEDHGSKPSLGKLSARPYLEKAHHKKRAGRVHLPSKHKALSSNQSATKNKRTTVEYASKL